MNYSTRSFFLFGFFFLIIPYIFWYGLGPNSYMTIHDGLDSEFVYIKLLLESGDLFGLRTDSQISMVMNGIERSYFRSGLNFTFLFFYLLPPAYAYITNHLIVHIIGYVGMFLLLKNYVIKKNDLIVMWISLCFSFLSYYHIQYGISLSGQPLLLYCFLNLLFFKTHYSNWLVICLFPLFSFLPVTLPFYLPLIALIGLIYYIENRKISWQFMLSIFAICAINLIVEFNLIQNTLFGDLISQRTAWDKLKIIGNPSLTQFLESLKNDFEYTQYHAGILSIQIVLISIVIGLVFRIHFTREIKLLMVLIIAIILWSALNPSILFLLGDTSEILKVFQFDRFYLILPFLWLLLFSMILNKYNWNNKWQKYSAILLLIIISVRTVKKNHELMTNINLVFNQKIDEPTFKQFYAKDLFDEIKNYLGKNNYEEFNFLSLGMYPNIAQFNQLKTLDSYQNNYSLDYKLAFRKIIKPELSKDETMRNSFDYWGSRCYLFSSEIGNQFLIDKNTEINIIDLNINLDAIKELKGKYILSSVIIENNSKQGLKYLKSFSNDDSFWMIHLYEVE